MGDLSPKSNSSSTKIVDDTLLISDSAPSTCDHNTSVDITATCDHNTSAEVTAKCDHDTSVDVTEPCCALKSKLPCIYDCGRCVCGTVHLLGRAGRACCKYDFKSRARKVCSLRTLRSHLPITQWLPKYRPADLKGDLIAGFSVALTVLPQGLAYAKIAELPTQYGLYTAFMGCLVYMFLGTSKDLNLGPTVIMSLFTAEFAHQSPPLAAVLALVCGIVQLLVGLLRIGFLVDYISHPVINSFTTAAAIMIACSQVKKWFGLTNIPRNFVLQAYWTLRKLPETKIWDFVLGLSCIVILYILKRMRDIKWQGPPKTLCKKVCEQLVWILSTARNALVVMATAGLAAILDIHDLVPFSLTGNITSGIPSFRFPSFDDDSVPMGLNETETMTAGECLSKIGIGIVIVPLVGIIEVIAVGKAFGRKNGYNIVPNQELLASGAANIMGAFISAYPVTGSFTRSAVASQSGARTPLGNLFTGGLVLLALAVLTPLFYFIPDAALAAVILMAVTDMIDFSMIAPLWRVNKVDLIPWFVTFLVSLLAGFEYGILIGIVSSLVLLLHPWARSKIRVDGAMDVVIVSIPIGLMFPGVEYLQEKVTRAAFHDGRAKSVILDFQCVYSLDYTAILGLKQLQDDLKLRSCRLVIAQAKPSVLKKLVCGMPKGFLSAGTVSAAVTLLQSSAESAVGDDVLLSVAQTSASHCSDKNAEDQQLATTSLLNNSSDARVCQSSIETKKRLSDQLHQH